MLTDISTAIEAVAEITGYVADSVTRRRDLEIHGLTKVFLVELKTATSGIGATFIVSIDEDQKTIRTFRPSASAADIRTGTNAITARTIISIPNGYLRTEKLQ